MIFKHQNIDFKIQWIWWRTSVGKLSLIELRFVRGVWLFQFRITDWKPWTCFRWQFIFSWKRGLKENKCGGFHLESQNFRVRDPGKFERSSSEIHCSNQTHGCCLWNKKLFTLIHNGWKVVQRGGFLECYRDCRWRGGLSRLRNGWNWDWTGCCEWVSFSQTFKLFYTFSHLWHWFCLIPLPI